MICFVLISFNIIGCKNLKRISIYKLELSTKEKAFIV